MMNKFKKVFVVVTGLFIFAHIGASLTGVNAGSGFGNAASFDHKEQAILKRNAKPKKLMRVPLFKQSQDFACGEVCLMSIMRYAGYDFDIREDNMSLALGSTKSKWVTVEKMTKFLNKVSMNEEEDSPCFKAKIRKNMTLDDLKKELDKNHLVICRIQDERCGKGENVTSQNNTQKHEHSVLAIGYDEDNIFFMDPLTSGNYTYLPNDQLDERWHNCKNSHVRVGVTVEICCTNKPDVERYNHAFYGLM